jgi:hypothetical protein
MRPVVLALAIPYQQRNPRHRRVGRQRAPPLTGLNHGTADYRMFFTAYNVYWIVESPFNTVKRARNDLY